MTWVTDHIFVAGGEFATEQWATLHGQTGITAIITVSVDKPGVFENPAPWAVLWLPLDDEKSYTFSHLQLGARFIADALADKRQILLHGPKGLHRARPLVAAHLLMSGKSLARVQREIEQRPWLPPYKGDLTLLEKFAESLKKDLTLKRTVEID
jgi:hypothetical protein